MTSVLQHIVQVKQVDLALRKKRLPPKTLESLVPAAPPVRQFRQALVDEGNAPAVIAEIKRASPSKGVLSGTNPISWDPVALAQAYERGGAACLSVLTDVRFFWGSDDTLALVRQSCSLPILRKDFIVDPYQIDESRWLGADAVLLMASVLPQATLVRCAERAQDLGLTALVEIAHEDELEVIGGLQALVDRADDNAPAPLLGINHRNLHTLELDMSRGERLRRAVPEGWAVVAESGIGEASTIHKLRHLGFTAFLVGGHLAAHADPQAALVRLRQ